MAEQDSRMEAERQMLRRAQQQGMGGRLVTYLRLSGPGWLQSAITLGGGSLANGLFLGIFAGFGLLWVQPMAMLLGVVMLGAIAYVTTTTGERPFRAINRHVNPVLGWSWLLASLMANIVWSLPQYSLASGVLQQNLLPGVVGPDSPLGDTGGKVVLSIAVLILTTLVTWTYDSGRWGTKLYEAILKTMVAGIVFCFFGVVFALRNELPWGEVLAGFVPDPSQLYRPSSNFTDLLAAVPDTYRQFWSDLIVKEQQGVVIGAAATAVGINMTFLYPYSMLAKGWTREFRGLAIFDLATGMLIPFMLATSCVVIAAANQFHPKVGSVAPPAGETLAPERAEELIAERLAFLQANRGNQEAEAATDRQPLTESESAIALWLTRRDAFDLARSLAPLTGPRVANYVFGLGVLGMTLSTITILMLISGFCVCEMLNVPARGWPHRLGCLAAAAGVLGPFLWSGEARFWLAVPTSVFGMMLLPIAYWTFFLLMNQKSLLGDDRPRGAGRVIWNGLMLCACSVAAYLCIEAIRISPFGPDGDYPYGFAILGGLVALAVAAQIARWAGWIKTGDA
ncbi:MAG: divalent metal cation transporter [Pirellulales bacterium]